MRLLFSVTVLSSIRFYGALAEYERSYSPASSQFTHDTGYVWNLTQWRTDVSQQSSAVLCSGPGADDAPLGGDLLVQFSLAVDNNSADDLQLVDLSVIDAMSGAVLVNSTVRRSDFEIAGVFQNFSIFITAPTTLSRLVYQVWYRCCSQITLAQIVVRSLEDSGPMSTFWNATAHWEFVSKAIFPSPDGASRARWVN